MKNEITTWKDFKELVKEFRILSHNLIKKQGGCNKVMLSIDLISYDINDWISLNPNSINLRTGMTLALVNGTYMNIDVKHLFLTSRLIELE